VFAGGPLRSKEPVDFADMDWVALDERHELELEIVGAAISSTLWFSVHEIVKETPIYFAVVVHMSQWFVGSPERTGIVPSGLSLSSIGSVGLGNKG
jgi:hypothetical protein